MRARQGHVRSGLGVCAGIAGLLGLSMMGGCGGKTAESASEPVASVVGPQATQTFVVHCNWATHSREISTFSFDFSAPERPVAAGKDPLFGGTFFSQLVNSVPEPCAPENEEFYNQVANTDSHPKDVGYVDTMQVEFSAFDRTPPDFLKACFAVHTKGGGWTWHWNQVPIVIDYGQPDVVAPGAGHFEFDIQTDNVDLVAISLVKDAGMNLTKVTYTAIPSPAR